MTGMATNWKSRLQIPPDYFNSKLRRKNQIPDLITYRFASPSLFRVSFVLTSDQFNKSAGFSFSSACIFFVKRIRYFSVCHLQETRNGVWICMPLLSFNRYRLWEEA